MRSQVPAASDRAGKATFLGQLMHSALRLACAVMSSASGCRGPAFPSSLAFCLVRLLAGGCLALPDAAASASAEEAFTCCLLSLCSLRVLGLCIGGRPAAASEAERSSRLLGPAEDPGCCVCMAVCLAEAVLVALCERLAGWVLVGWSVSEEAPGAPSSELLSSG